MSDVPPPLEWHPWYRGKSFLIDWLNNTEPQVVIPVLRSIKAVFDEDPAPTAVPSFSTLTLTKQRAWGPAPWTGRPFHYEWNFATDALGRSIAGESRIVHDRMYAGLPAEWWGLE